MNEEKDAVIRLKHGDILGLEYLVNKYYFKALRSSFFITLDQEKSADIVQTVFLQLCKKIKHYDEKRAFEPWFMQCVVNASLDNIKKYNRIVYLDQNEISEGVLLFNELIDFNNNPEMLIEISQLKDTIWQALQKLTTNQRAAVVLRYYLDMKLEDISLELKAPLSSIKWWLHTGRKRLKTFLLGTFNSEKEG